MDVTLFLNHQCNLACTYCYNGEKFDSAIDTSTITKGVDLAFSKGNARLSFFGGEPLLEFKKIQYAVQYANQISKQKKGSIRYSVTTNGTLLNERILAFFSNNSFHVAISIDGTKEAHDSTRPFKNGESSFPLVLSNLKTALAILPNVATISVIDPQNVTFLNESFLAFVKLGVTDINFSINYTAKWDAQSLDTFQSELDKIADQYVDLYRSNIDFKLDLIDHKIISHLKGGYASCDKCKFGDAELCVTPKGNLYPCERLVGEDDNEDIMIGHIDSGIDFGKVMKMITAKNTPDEDCEQCHLKHRCMFWCGCANYETTGNVGKTGGIICQTEQMIIQAADRAAEILYREKNPLFIENFYEPHHSPQY